MGTWGVHIFENDTALDWVGTKLVTGGIEAISAAMKDVLDVEDNIDLETAQIGIAAIGALVAAMGQGRAEEIALLSKLPEIDVNQIEELVRNANFVVMRVTGGSELRNLWEEADWDEREAWIASLVDLRSRVNAENAVAVDDMTSSEDTNLSGDLSLEDIRMAIGSLDARLIAVHSEVMEGLARIARKVEALER